MRSDPSFLVARAEPGAEARWTIRAPAVGIWVDPPDEGRVVGTGSPVGKLSRLGRHLELRLPELPPGRVCRVSSQRKVAVGYLDTLFHLLPIELADGSPAGEFGSAGVTAAAGSEAAAWSVVAPTEGVFYRRMEPNAPPLVDVGSRVRIGQTIGLIEVMKTYNQIVFGGSGAPAEGEVVEIRVSDGDEVKAGQVLVLVRG